MKKTKQNFKSNSAIVALQIESDSSFSEVGQFRDYEKTMHATKRNAY